MEFFPQPFEKCFQWFKGVTTKVKYEFGEMAKSEYYRCYKRNMSTSGVEIRINGRLIVDNLFTEIWGIEKHNNYNHFLVRIDLLSDNPDALPRTRTSKNAIRPDDEILQGLFSWIKKTKPHPPKKLSDSATERELVEKLEENFNIYIKDQTKHIEAEFKVFTQIGSAVPVDLYVFDGKVTRIYEAKRDIADVQAVYQLVMYWDGLVRDDQNPDEGVIVASRFSGGVSDIIAYFNQRQDHVGNSYKLSTTTWKEEGIDYPPKN